MLGFHNSNRELFSPRHSRRLVVASLLIGLSLMLLKHEPSKSMLAAVTTVSPTRAEEELETRDRVANWSSPPITLLDVQGQVHRLHASEWRNGAGFVFTSTECPIARKYVPEFNRMAAESSTRKSAFYLVLCEPELTRQEALKWTKEFGVTATVLFDGDGELLDELRPTHTPESFVIDRSGEVIYQGRIDNLYADIGRPRREADKRELRSALKSLNSDDEPLSRYEKPIGCPIERPRSNNENSEVTFTRDVAPLLYKHCVACHREGEVAPFELVTYEDAQKRAAWIAEITDRRQMPPWQPKPDFGEFKHEARLSAKEIKLLKTWAAQGAPQGDERLMPPLPAAASHWSLGEPDLIVTMPTPIEVPADGQDLFRWVPLEVKIPEGKMIRAIDLRPGNREVVHHAILAALPREVADALASSDSMPAFDLSSENVSRVVKMIRSQMNSPVRGGMIGAWVPGMQPHELPEGSGIRLSPEQVLLLQMHYYPTGRPEVDQSQVAIYLTEKEAVRPVLTVPMNKLDLKIPANASRQVIQDRYTLPVDGELLGIGPHMHLLGREMKVTARLPDGTERPLIWIDDWDWNWQGQYIYREPLHLPAGTVIELEAVYDNSTNNPWNPHSPPQTVRFGRKTDDEMCLCFLQFGFESQDDAQKAQRSVMRQRLQRLGRRWVEQAR